MPEDQIPINEYTVRAAKCLQAVLEELEPGDFCGCYEGDIDARYPEGCKILVKMFIERFTGRTAEELLNL